MEIDELVKAVQTLNAEDAFRARLTLDNWRTIAPYLARYEIRAGDLLIKQGDADRSMYFLAQGSMQIFMTGGPPGSSKVAILRAGAVVGEPGLFGDTPRMANVEAMTPCVVWALRGPRMEELAQRSPALALELLRAAGAVMARACARRSRSRRRSPDRSGAAPRRRAPARAARPRPRASALRQPRQHQRVAGGQPSASSGCSTAPVGAPQRHHADAERRQRRARRACGRRAGSSAAA